MIDQNTADSREQWLKDQAKKHSEYVPISRKFGRGSVEPIASQPTTINQFVTNKPIESSAPIFDSKNKNQISKPNPFPFNRQHRSRVIYRNLDKSVDELISVNKTILKHGSIKAGS
jgi:hypothetical protein